MLSSSATAKCSLKNALTCRAPSSDPSFITRIQSPKTGGGNEAYNVNAGRFRFHVNGTCFGGEELHAIINTCTIST